MFNTILNTENKLSTTILRLTVGIVMFPHGAQKMLGWFGGYGFSGTMGLFTDDLGIPALFAFLAIITEFLGSIALITGALTRLWALGMTVLMTVAMFMNHVQHGFFMNWYGQQAGEGFEYHLLVIGISLALLILGGGKWSLDRLYTQRNR